MSKYIKAPWRLFYREKAIEIESIPLNTSFVFIRNSDSSIAEQAEATAERVVACVNACEGIEDPSVIPELLADFKRRALFPCSCDDSNPGGCDSCYAAWTLARAEGRK
jgi:hypothetical protein